MFRYEGEAKIQTILFPCFVPGPQHPLRYFSSGIAVANGIIWCVSEGAIAEEGGGSGTHAFKEEMSERDMIQIGTEEEVHSDGQRTIACLFQQASTGSAYVGLKQNGAATGVVQRYHFFRAVKYSPELSDSYRSFNCARILVNATLLADNNSAVRKRVWSSFSIFFVLFGWLHAHTRAMFKFNNVVIVL